MEFSIIIAFLIYMALMIVAAVTVYRYGYNAGWKDYERTLLNKWTEEHDGIVAEDKKDNNMLFRRNKKKAVALDNEEPDPEKEFLRS